MVGLTSQYERGNDMPINMNEVIASVTLTKVCSVSPDTESKKDGVTKQVTVRVKFDGATVQSVFDKAVAGAVIQWQNGVGRKAFDTLKAGQVVDIQFTAPASRTAVAPEDAFLAGAKADGIDVTDEKALAAYIIKRMKKA